MKPVQTSATACKFMPQPQIVFYEIPDKDSKMLVRASCKLICEYYRASTNVHIITTDETTLTSLDETLWSYPVNSFVPHKRASTRQTSCIVTMDTSPQYEGNGKVLINLTPDVPVCIGQFETVCEFVMQQPKTKEQARLRFVQYRNKYGKPKFVNLADWDNRPILD